VNISEYKPNEKELGCEVTLGLFTDREKIYDLIEVWLRQTIMKTHKTSSNITEIRWFGKYLTSLHTNYQICWKQMQRESAVIEFFFKYDSQDAGAACACPQDIFRTTLEIFLMRFFVDQERFNKSRSKKFVNELFACGRVPFPDMSIFTTHARAV
jgi:hypothetical protein